VRSVDAGASHPTCCASVGRIPRANPSPILRPKQARFGPVRRKVRALPAAAGSHPCTAPAHAALDRGVQLRARREYGDDRVDRPHATARAMLCTPWNSAATLPSCCERTVARSSPSSLAGAARSAPATAASRPPSSRTGGSAAAGAPPMTEAIPTLGWLKGRTPLPALSELVPGAPCDQCLTKIGRPVLC
jgi:hypothetical protein